MTFEQLSAKFQNFEGPFPEEALIESVKNREMVSPELLKTIRKALEDPQGVIDRDDYMMSIYSMYLLAQFREKKAYPVIIDFFLMPDEKALEIVGDMFIEDLGRILASVSCGDISLLRQLIENSDAQELIRSSAIEALMVLVKVGEKSRDEIVAYFRELFAGKLERRRSLVWVSLVSSAIDLYPEEVLAEIEKAFDEGLVDETLINISAADEAVLEEKDKALDVFFQNSQYSLIQDVVQEMSDSTA